MGNFNDGMRSSNTDLWSTPDDFFKMVDREFSFELDVCATKDNAKCLAYYTFEDDGLLQDWSGRCWMNPPYGREIGKWVAKAFNSDCDVVVGLLPARTDTKWFHDYIYGKAEIRFIKGRLKFGCAKNNAPFPSMLVIWRKSQ